MKKAIVVRCEGSATLSALLRIGRAVPRVALQGLQVDIRLPTATKAELAQLKRELEELEGRASLKA